MNDNKLIFELSSTGRVGYDLPRENYNYKIDAKY